MSNREATIVMFPLAGVTITCADLTSTRALAGTISESLRTGDVVLLDGDLAAGKTTFVSLMCRALGSFDQPSSPTYVISNIYACPFGEIFHIDAYRLGGVDDFYQLGIDEFLPNVVTFIEWGERVASAFPSCLKIKIDFLADREDGRIFEITSTGVRWHPVIGKLATHPLRSSSKA